MQTLLFRYGNDEDEEKKQKRTKLFALFYTFAEAA